MGMGEGNISLPPDLFINISGLITTLYYIFNDQNIVLVNKPATPPPQTRQNHNMTTTEPTANIAVTRSSQTS